jgi:hypothetical protein
MVFNVWVSIPEANRWTNSGQSQETPIPKSYQEAEILMASLRRAGWKQHELSIRELLPDNTCGQVYEQDPGCCPQCGQIHP